MRTSASYPLQIAELALLGVPGRLGLTFCPGKRQRHAATGAWARELDADLARVAAWGAAAVLTLMEEHELTALMVPGLGAAVRARGMAWHVLPIRDAGVPDAGFEQAWATLAPGLHRRLAEGQRVLLHCKGGLGRTGTIAARLLVEHGMTADAAIGPVRAVRPGAVETPAQEAYLHGLERRGAAQGARTPSPAPAPAAPGRLERVRGCLLAGACGDALGAPVEFLSLMAIRRRYGPAGITAFDAAYGRIGAVTDDTQMSLWTAEGLLRAAVQRAVTGSADPVAAVHAAYLRWLVTQGDRPAQGQLAPALDGWLVGVRGLWSRRAPGGTCLGALRASPGLGVAAVNASKGCGGVMRNAPAGLIGAVDPFRLGAELAGLSHGHPTGRLAAGHLSALVAGLVDGLPLPEALDRADEALAAWLGHEEIAAAVATARALAGRGDADAVPAELGQGWVAEEALAIALWCVLAAPDPQRALVLAVNHDGDGDSTGSIAGQILGALHGPGWLPAAWLEQVPEIERLAADLAAIAADPATAATLRDAYPVA